MGFKIGDKIVCINNERYKSLELYKEYTIRKIHMDMNGFEYLLFDEYNGLNRYEDSVFLKSKDSLQIIRREKINKIKEQIFKNTNKTFKCKLINIFK